MSRIFFPALRHRWLELLLGSLVIALPVAAMSVHKSLASTTDEQVHELAHGLGKNMLVLPAGADLGDLYALSFDGASMPDDYPERLARSGIGRHIGHTESRLYGDVLANRKPALLVGERRYRRGRAVASGDPAQATLGPAAGGLLGATTGDGVEVGAATLRVAGTRKATTIGLDGALFTSLDTAQNILGRHGEVHSLRLGGCWCSLDVPTLAGQVEDTLPNTQALTISGVLDAQKGTIATLREHTRALQLGSLAFIAFIAVVLVSSQVRRQRRQMALLLAVGGRPSFVAAIYVTRAALMGAVGAAAGVLLGHPLTETVALHLVGAPLAPESFVSSGVLLSAAVGVSVAAALIPAVRAARLDPTTTLREA